MYEDGQPQVATQRYERRCSACTKWFWAWDADRMNCYICQPLPKEELQRFKATIGFSNGSGNRNGRKPVAATVVQAVASTGWWSGWAQWMRATGWFGRVLATPGAKLVRGELQAGSSVSR